MPAGGVTAACPPTHERTWRPSAPLDVALTLAPHRRGGGDPAWRRTPDGAVWRTSRTPDGPASLRVTGAGGQITGQAWGPGARWMLETLPHLLGEDDDLGDFADTLRSVTRAARSGTQAARTAAFVGDLAARSPGLRIGRSSRVFEALVPAVLEQKVVGREAWRAWRWLLLRYGEPAPGPAPDGMMVTPPPEIWRRIPSWDWHRAGAEAVRARTIVNAAHHADKLERTAGPAPSAGSSLSAGSPLSDGPDGSDGPAVFTASGVSGGPPGSPGSRGAGGSAEADRLLRALPGVGVWTSAEVRQRAHGDPDAPSVGDYHLPAIVGWALTGRKADDDGMLELLEPFRGHRHRVIRLIELSGVRPPARGPRMPARDYRSF
ncbi:DNA-3-methyladenine glycosylase family protein [Microbispora oryzae]|uniref:DNA-3-methyladenine glycosylase family protein n=1 Tax=Microbispora oryzae TaxID=2806554 RepID=UPI001E4BAB6B|nr:DNA-3-methyladenine glycosylase 2 family protein [Microbispora oryzae]